MERIFSDLPEHKIPVLEDIIQMFQSLHRGNISTAEQEGRRPKEWKGHRFIPMFSPAVTRRYFEDMEIEENTIFVASYPKTGTNWTMEIIRQIVFGENEKFDTISKNLPPIFGMLEMGKPEKLDLLEHIALPRRMLCTHLPAELVDFEKMKKAKAKIVILIRNPKDQAVSWFHFTKQKFFDIIRDEINPDWPQFFLDYVHGKHPTISKPGEWYPEFLLGWHKYKDEDNVLFVHFEDMKRDPQVGVKRIADFLEIKLTDDRVADIAKATSFDVMKKTQESRDSESAKVLSNINMFRKGQPGAWKDTFTVAQSELMDKIIEEKLGHTDIKFRYE